MIMSTQAYVVNMKPGELYMRYFFREIIYYILCDFTLYDGKNMLVESGFQGGELPRNVAGVTYNFYNLSSKRNYESFVWKESIKYFEGEYQKI